MLQKHFAEESVGGILHKFFSRTFRCECGLPGLRRELLDIESVEVVNAVMVKLFFDAIFQAAVHCYSNELFEEYETKFIDHDVYIFSHGGSRHVYKPFLDGVPRSVIVSEGAKVVRVWREEFSELFGSRVAGGLIHQLILDSDFRHALSLALTQKLVDQFLASIAAETRANSEA